MPSALMDICINHINISPNHLFSLILFPCETLLLDLFLLTFYRLLPLPPFSSSGCVTLSVSLSLPAVSHHSFCCQSTLVIRLSVLIMALLIIVQQIIIQTFHSNEVRGVIQRVKAATSSLDITCLNCRVYNVVPAKRVSTATVMWDHHADVLHSLASYYCTPVSGSMRISDPSCRSELQMKSAYIISACVP